MLQFATFPMNQQNDFDTTHIMQERVYDDGTKKFLNPSIDLLLTSSISFTDITISIIGLALKPSIAVEPM